MRSHGCLPMLPSVPQRSSLERNNIDAVGCIKLAEALVANSSLVKLMSAGFMRQASRLRTAVPGPALRSRWRRVLVQSLTVTGGAVGLSFGSLFRNNIGVEGCCKMAEALAVNVSLHEL